MIMSMTKEERNERTEDLLDDLERLVTICQQAQEQLLQELEPVQNPDRKVCQS